MNEDIEELKEAIDKLLKENETLREEVHKNSLMLKEIIKYINYTILTANQENMNDFGRNVMANLLSSLMVFK